MYKILVVDDSALMRRIICDIINADNDFRVVDVSADGEDAYNKIKNNPYDIVVLDMVLPKLTGLQLLERLTSERIPFNIVLISSVLKEDADETVRAMELGALEFVVKPIRSGSDTRDVFGNQLKTTLHNVTKLSSFKNISRPGGSSDNTRAIEESRRSTQARMENVRNKLAEARSNSGSAHTETPASRPASSVQRPASSTTSTGSSATRSQTTSAPRPSAQSTSSPGASVSCNVSSGERKTPSSSKPSGSGVRTKKFIALACSTGGPQALHTFVPMLPANLSVPLVLVQHMPEGFTASLAQRLDQISAIHVKEAEDGEFFKPGWVYVTPGGKHMEICEDGSHAAYCHLNDSPPVNSLKPCADVMYRSLKNSSFDEIICVVLTGMGADGSEGIKYLKQYKKTYVISQEASTCVVYGMPKAVEQGGLANEVAPLKSVANSIVKRLGG
ncbi:two-component system, chemotaxis family, response regulator CheB [Pseudobutyrivibrio sp. YE44]|uniref:chemotaxis-specific protein-glutamate methyltransferase CheB n=1 Tax=Pseudobutyrivibrio sp. YE44 TaxID=1520802 RepID=UPI000884C1F7|nr:chemotaxis-specific protein-glutamate methyltransferase CheB [Pseudobutyrivibrio sp. YE44]SDB11050.1 two-component system, chemotaxis family, response regulator CheB [Pseudobutyrivibrio sp. YE44]